MEENNKISAIKEFSVPNGMVSLSDASLMLIEQMKHVKNNPQAIPETECMIQIAGRLCDIAKAQVEQGRMIADMIRVKNSH